MKLHSSYDFPISTKFNEWKKDWVNSDTKQPSDFDWQNYVDFHFKPEDFIMMASILLPKFIEIDNLVFLEKNFSNENYNGWKSNLKENFLIEQHINHVHAYDIFSSSNNVNEKYYLCICELLKITWESSLNNLFPNRNFIFEIYEDYGYTITFYQSNI